MKSLNSAMIDIAETIKNEISQILLSAVNGQEKKYRTETGYIRWGLVEKDIHAVVNRNLFYAPSLKNDDT